jgi:hypothetical protein
MAQAARRRELRPLAKPERPTRTRHNDRMWAAFLATVAAGTSKKKAVA